jgi:hypothetical protein
MPSPLPGMDPYLEHPRAWPNLHHRLITAIAIHLGPQLRPKYRVVVEEALYQTTEQDAILVGRPDVAVTQTVRREAAPANAANGIATIQPIEISLPAATVIRQGYLEIRDVTTSEVVTALEVLSPTNKRPGAGRRTYEAKRQIVLASATNLVEIDLLRQWPPLTPSNLASHYRILISASAQRPSASLYAFNLPDPIPPFPLPLRAEDPEPILHLKPLIDDIYDQSGYDLVIDYAQPPVPDVSEGDRVWLTRQLNLPS